MLIAIYGREMGTAECITWLLCEEEGVGPQIFTIEPLIRQEDGLFSRIITDDRDLPEFIDHNICSQRIENSRGKTLCFIDSYRKYTSQFQHVIWGSHYACIKNPRTVFTGLDRLILCKTDLIVSMFHYLSGFAFNPISDEEHFERDCALWWQDHTFVDGDLTSRWKEVWYGTYHDRIKQQFIDGELKYMWQLNFIFWDLHKAILNEEKNLDNIELEPHDNTTRIWETKLKEFGDEPQDDLIATHKEAGVDFLQVNDPDWTSQLDEILDYLKIKKSKTIEHNLEQYKTLIEPKREWFEEAFSKELAEYRNNS
jgi:hypothetical protein